MRASKQSSVVAEETVSVVLLRLSAMNQLGNVKMARFFDQRVLIYYTIYGYLSSLYHMTVLEQFLGSPQEVHLLRFFIFHPDEDFTKEELLGRLGKRIVGTGRVLKTLTTLGALVLVERTDRSTGYRVNTSWLLFPEFRALLVKAQLLVEHDFVRKLEKTGQVKLLILAGLFVGQRGSATDVLMVGNINQRRVMRLMKSFEQDLDQEVRYTILTINEYRYRKNVGDRFLYDVLEGRHLVVLDLIDRPKAGVPAKKILPRSPASRRR